MKCFRPGMVEDKFAPGVTLLIKGHCGHDATAATQYQVFRLPACSDAGATAGLKRRQEFVTEKRIATGVEAIPLLRSYVLDRLEGMDPVEILFVRRRLLQGTSLPRSPIRPGRQDTFRHPGPPCSRFRRT